MAKSYEQPSVTWLRITEFMRGGLEYQLGGDVNAGGQRVICLWHLSGARDVLRMETSQDVTLEPSERADGDAGRQRLWEHAMSATRRSVIEAGLKLDADVTERLYGLTREELRKYVPIECPRLCLTQKGVLRPWTADVCFGEAQVKVLQKLLREVYWQTVEQFADRYARRHEGLAYAQQDMIEAFCQETKTSDIHVEAIRREWQRRAKRTTHGSK